MRNIKMTIISIGMIMMGIMIIFQSCGNLVDFGADTLNDSGDMSVDMSSVPVVSGKIVINNGSEFTNRSNVSLKIISSYANQIYITNDSGCETGGVWEDVSGSKTWTLMKENEKATVYARFRSDSGILSSCVSASIIHDNIAPELTIDEAPGQYTQNTEAEISFSASDEGSSIKKISCQFDDMSSVECKDFFQIADLGEALHSVKIEATDNAGNKNSIVTQWVVDKTAPVLIVTKTPDAQSTTSVAQFEFQFSDENGSGFGNEYLPDCQFDKETPRNCSSATSHEERDLPDGERHGKIVVKDQAGNRAIFEHTWSIDTQGPGDFMYAGITGDKDSKRDQFLSHGLNARVHWTPSSDVDHYLVTILDSEGIQVVCPEVQIGKNSQSHFFECQLVDGQNYQVRAYSVDTFGNRTLAKHPQQISQPLFYKFIVDATAPLIAIEGPNQDDDATKTSAKFKIDVSPDPGGLGPINCALSGPQGVGPTVDCSGGEIKFMNLIEGNYTLLVSARDLLGNASQKSVSWTNKPVTCDPSQGITHGCAVAPLCDLINGTEQEFTHSCIAMSDSFEREQITGNEVFQWQKIIMDYGAFGENVDAELVDDYVHDCVASQTCLEYGQYVGVGHVGPVADGHKAVLFRGRDGGSTHEIYLVAKSIDASQFEYLYITFKYLPLSLENSIRMSFGEDLPESIRIDICKDSDLNCGLIGSNVYEKLRDKTYWDRYWPVVSTPTTTEPFVNPPFGNLERGENLNLVGHYNPQSRQYEYDQAYQMSDWKDAQILIDLNRYPTRKGNMVFKVTATMDEGYWSNDRSKTLEDGILLDHVHVILGNRPTP